MSQVPSPTTTQANTVTGSPDVSLSGIFLRFKWRISFTLSLVVAETLLELLYPLLIGWAINDLLADSYRGIWMLLGLGIGHVLIGSTRRFYDTRLYARIYRKITPEMVDGARAKGQPVSSICARSNLLTEFVEFFENSMPEVISALIGMIGVLSILAALNMHVFLACLGLLGLMALIYLLTGTLNYRLNSGYNAELEQQVACIEQNNAALLNDHYKRLMGWNIKLSDLETGNYFFIWIGVLALLVFAPVAAVSGGSNNYGLLFSLLIYVFDYIGKVATLPLYVQQLIRLREIADRINRV